jgi:hypothetical protein
MLRKSVSIRGLKRPRPLFSFSVHGQSPTGWHRPSGDAPWLFGPGNGRLRGSLTAADIRLFAQCPAAKLLETLPEGKGTVPADKILQPLLKDIELPI